MENAESAIIHFSGIDGTFEVPVNEFTREAIARLYTDETGKRIATGTSDAELLLQYALKRNEPAPEPIREDMAAHLTYLDALMERLQGDMEEARELVARLKTMTRS